MPRYVWDFPLNWLLKPFILILIIPFYIYNLIYQWRLPRAKRYWIDKDTLSKDELIHRVEFLVNAMQIFKNDERDLVLMRVPCDQEPSGFNHNTDHQCSRQGCYLALLSKLFINSRRAASSLAAHWFEGELRRGYKIREGDLTEVSDKPVSGDMLCGFAFGYVHSKDELLTQAMDIALHLLEHKGLRTQYEVSRVANFLPGVNDSDCPIPVGAQELTYLVGIRMGMDAYKVVYGPFSKGFKALQREYWKRFYLYGAWITILIPTVGIKGNRGYSNDNNCMMATYALYKLSSNWFERMVYRVSIFVVWSMSFVWLNGFFSGILREVTGGKFPNDEYMDRCLKYAYDLGEYTYSKEWKSESENEPMNYPIEPQMRLMGEFLPDEAQDYIYVCSNKGEFKSCLGQLVNLVWSLK
jgi:hypothetical protein